MNTDIEMTGEDEYRLPCTEALLAGTLALMTGHAQACCDNRRQWMSAKIVANLAQLSAHSTLSPQFRAALWSLRAHWETLRRERAEAANAGDPRLWHAGPSSLQ